MNFSKKITAGAVALALGASAMVAPQARALPAEFVSPPNYNLPRVSGCAVGFGDELGSTAAESIRGTRIAGAEVGVSRTIDGNDIRFTPWVTLSGEDQRIFTEAKVDLGIIYRNGAPGSTQSYTVNPVPKGAQVDTKNQDGTQSRKVTDTVVLGDKNLQLSLDASAKYEAGVVADGSTQTWAWTVDTTSVQANSRSAVYPSVEALVAPWPFENDSCEPLVPNADKTNPVIADGTEYDTGITVTNGSKSDFARLGGQVFEGTKLIDDAQVRIDASGKVYVTLPKRDDAGADDAKPASVTVKLVAAPRVATAESDLDAYNAEQTLRVTGEKGEVTNASETFEAAVPLAKFAPEYQATKPVLPGDSATADIDAATFADVLRDEKGEVREGSTFAITQASVEGWNPQIDAKTGQVTVTAPQDAKEGDKVTVDVAVTYPDNTTDTLRVTFTVTNNKGAFDPKYGETRGTPGTKVTLKQRTEGLPEGTTYVISENQELGEWKPVVGADGTITVTIPEGAQPGDEQTILVDVTYPDGSVDKQVPAKVIVLNVPGYDEETGKPGEEVTLPQTGKVTEGSTFELTPEQNLGEWDPKVDPTTGVITVVIPEGAKDGDRKDIKVTVTDPDNPDNPDVVTATVIVREDKPATPREDKDKTPGTPVTPGAGNTIIVVFPGTTIELNPSFNLNPDGTNKDPEGTKYEIKPGWQAPGGWNITINPDTGKLTITPPADAMPGDKVTVPVQVTLPNGETVIREVPVVVPGQGGITLPEGWTFNPQAPTVVYVPVPAGTPDSKIQLPEGWTYTRDGNTIVINPGGGFEGGNIKLPGGNGDVDVRVEVDNAGKLGEENGSSEEAKRCFTKLSTEPNSPLLWLLPGAILLAVGAPLVGPMGQEIGKAIANVSAQINIDLPNPWGNGGERRENPVVATFNAEMARLNNMFGPQVAQAGVAALALLSLAAMAGLMAWYCQDDNSEKLSSGMWDNLPEREGSSDN